MILLNRKIMKFLYFEFIYNNNEVIDQLYDSLYFLYLLIRSNFVRDKNIALISIYCEMIQKNNKFICHLS